MSVVVRCYNERDHIGRLLYGVEQQSRDDVEVVLVDSGSTDGTLEIAAEYGVEEVVHLPPEEFSYGRGLNEGCRAASGDVCVFASAHVYPRRRDWLDRLVEPLGGDVALTYGRQRGGGESSYPERRVFRQWFPETNTGTQRSPFCNNANAAVRRSVWESLPYDEELPALEDIDWARRARKRGYTVTYVAEAVVEHVHDETPHEVYERYRREAVALASLFPGLRLGIGGCLRTAVANVVRDYRAAHADGVLWENLGTVPQFRLAQFLGVYRGFATTPPVAKRVRERLYGPDVSESRADTGVTPANDSSPRTENNLPSRTADDTGEQRSGENQTDDGLAIDYGSHSKYVPNDIL